MRRLRWYSASMTLAAVIVLISCTSGSSSSSNIGRMVLHVYAVAAGLLVQYELDLFGQSVEV